MEKLSKLIALVLLTILIGFALGAYTTIHTQQILITHDGFEVIVFDNVFTYGGN